MKALAAVAGLLMIALPCAAQPRLTNARVTERAVAGGLDATVRQIVDAATEPAWIAWAAPVADGRSNMCCFSGDWNGGMTRGGQCRLEPGSGTTIMTRDTERATRLELPDTFFVFVRVENREIERVRMFSEDCGVDAGGRPVTWLTGVAPAESVALLASVAGNAAAANRAMKGAVSALAQHGGPEAIQPLIRLARQAPDTKVRGEALFWLSQRAGARAAAAITEAIEHDPETEVKKRAVFALSQLPADDGVPKLIEVARTHRNLAVKKQAMFWLGQSKDPRALAFFEEILK
jgi:hypothetical protein